MLENYIFVVVVIGIWIEEEIRYQFRVWIRLFINIDALRFAFNNFFESLLRKENLRIILIGVGTSVFIGDIIASWFVSYIGKNFSVVSIIDLVINSMDYLNLVYSLLLIFFGRFGNSSESVVVVELVN